MVLNLSQGFGLVTLLLIVVYLVPCHCGSDKNIDGDGPFVEDSSSYHHHEDRIARKAISSLANLDDIQDRQDVGVRRHDQRRHEERKIRDHLGPIKNSEAKFFVDESTKLIYIDADSESGYLIGEISNRMLDTKSNGQTGRTPSKFFSDSVERSHSETITKNKAQESEVESRATNYSVYLISQHKSHIAIMIDIVDINFEPIVNCEYQELKFSVVGLISQDWLNADNATDEKNTQLGGDEKLSTREEDIDTDELNQENQHDDNSDAASPALSVSEAMTVLLNAPLNKTILDNSHGLNDFKIIDLAVDYLHEETCQEMMNVATNKSFNHYQQSRQDSLGKKKRKLKIKTRHRNHRKNAERDCNPQNQSFKDNMTSKLGKYFEWDDFNIVCGKTNQIIIPMRSIKLSVYSDEFAPNSHFVIRYRFVSDPMHLPGFDNGKYFCRNRKVIDLSLKCDGYDDCGDASDESIKVCGYPTGKISNSEIHPQHASNSSSSSKRVKSPSDLDQHNRVKLTYINGDALHCCQPSDWLNLIPSAHQSGNSANHLQSLIGDSMNLLTGPSFAPIKQTTGQAKGKKRVRRVVGGSEALKGNWPSQVSLQYEILEPLCHFCAGTLIHPLYVLTAGHCISKEGLARGIKVVLGAHDIRKMNSSTIQTRYVDDALIYPGVDVKKLNFEWENDMNNDVALLRLNAPVLLTQSVLPACLPPFHTPLTVNTTCKSIGWGETHGSGGSNVLKQIPLRVIKSSACTKELFDQDSATDRAPHPARKSDNNLNGRGRRVSDLNSAGIEQYSNVTMICVKNDNGHSICQGDSGGPMFCDRILDSGERCSELNGIASFIIQYSTIGAMCAAENLPGIFSEVSSKTEWISSAIKMFEQTYRLKYSPAD